MAKVVYYNIPTDLFNAICQIFSPQNEPAVVFNDYPSYTIRTFCNKKTHLEKDEDGKFLEIITQLSLPYLSWRLNQGCTPCDFRAQ